MSFEQSIEQAIDGAIRSRVKAIAEEEIAAANQRVQQRVNDEIDKVALRVLKQYEVFENGDRIIIQVKKL